jgi:DNA-binding response OmpR family regulator
VLVAEGEEQIRQMLVEALAGVGYRVEAAADGLTALARFQQGGFDLVLTDLSLPERSGLEVARAVKRLRPGTPVVLVSGWGQMLDPVELQGSGVDLTLIKPFRLDRVLAVCAEALRLGRLA